MLRPFIFVGCGGSGVRTVHKIRQELEQELREHGYQGAFPTAWQFLTIDVPSTNQAGGGSTEISYVGLADSAILYKGANSADETLATKDSSRADYLQWRPNPEHVHVNLEIGAGQYRAVGRVASATWGASKVAGHIGAAASKCTDDWGTLDAVAKALGIEVHAGAERPTPYVVLISSLGGGAGSGIFLDVADMIRLSAEGSTPWLQSGLIGVLYDPSVFDSGIDPVATKGIPANSLAAISELVAAQWCPWDVSPHLGGFTGSLGNYAGTEYAFLVGSSNGEVDFSTADDVYGATSRAIAAWALNPAISTKMDEITLGNWAAEAAKSTLEFHRPDGNMARMPLSALGYAKVDLGRARFGLYAEERLTREAIELMLNRHVDAQVLAGKKTSDDAAAERVRQNDFELVVRFLNTCALNEDGIAFDTQGGVQGQDQVLDAIRDDALLGSERQTKIDKVLSRVTSAAHRLAQLDGAWEEEFTGWSQSMKAHHVKRAVEWAERIQPKVLDAVFQSIALNGLLVTQKLLIEVQHRVGVTFPEQLHAEKDSGHLKVHAKAWEQRRSDAALTNTKSSAANAAKQRMGILLDCYVKSEVGRDLRDIAAAILSDMAENFFAPLIKSLDMIRQELTAEYNSTKYTGLASATTVPQRLQPGKTELFVENATKFPTLFDNLIAGSAGTVEQALVNIVQGNLAPDTDHRSLALELQPIPVHHPWVPGLAQQLLDPKARATAHFQFGLATNSIRNRARYWLTADPSRTIGRYLKTTLSDYLLDQDLSEPARESRIKDFCKLLEEAFRKAKPLADVQWAWTTSKLKLDKEHGTIRYLSKVPIPAPTQQEVGGKVSAAREIGKVLESALGTTALGDFFSPSDATSIDVFSMLRPLPPSGFLSLTKPITASKSLFDANNNASLAGDEFWLNRSARPFLDGLPIPNAVRKTYARGWLTGLLTGRLEFTLDQGGAVDLTKPIRIKTSDDKQMLSFAFPPLGAVTGTTPEMYRKVAAFAMVLNSALFAEMQAASTGNEDSMRALIELLKLGTGDGSGTPHSLYGANLHQRLKALANEYDASDPGNGYSALADVIGAAHKALADHMSSYKADPSVWSPYPLELAVAPLYLTAATELIHAIKVAATQKAADSGPKNPLL